MIRRFILRWSSRYLSSQRKDPRDKIRAKAINMAKTMGRADLVARLER